MRHTSTGWVGCAALLLLFSAACSDPDGSVAVAAPDIHAFSAEPAVVVRGGAAALTWRVSGATALAVVDDDQIEIAVAQGVDAASGSVSVMPDRTTTYTLVAIARGDGQTSPEATAQVTVRVEVPAAPTVTLSADPLEVAPGSPTTLVWSSTATASLALTANGAAVDIEGLPVGRGTLAHSPTEPTLYVLTATGPGGTATAEAEVTLLPAPAVVTFAADPGSIVLGQSAVLTWSSTGASSAELLADGQVVESGLMPSGSVEVTPTDTTVYTLRVTGPGGAAEAQATVAVDRTLRATLTAPESVDFGQVALLAWTTTAAQGLELVADPGGPVDIVGKRVDADSVELSPEVTTVYTLTATQDAQSAVAVATVVVNPAVSIESLTATPEVVFVGQSALIAWETHNAARVVLRVGDTEEEVPGAGERTFGELMQATTYTLVAEGVGGPVEQSVTVEVTERPIPVIRSFAVAPPSIGLDETATLSWQVDRATTLRLRGMQAEGPDIDIPIEIDQLEAGSVELGPALTTRYTLTAINEHGMASAQVELEVPIAIAEFAAAPDAIHEGDSVQVNWRLQGATSMQLTVNGQEVLGAAFGPDGRGDIEVSGAPPLTIQILARNDVEEVSETLTVDGLGPQIREFGADRDEVEPDGLATLNWLTSRGLTGFQLAAMPAVGDGFDVPVEPEMWEGGNTEVTPAFDTTYVLNASSDFGFTFAVVRVRVPLRILAFEAVPSPAIYGENVELRWTVQGAEGVEFRLGDDEPMMGFVGENGFGTGELASVTAPGTVELTAFVGENGRVTGELELEVAPPLVELFGVSPDVGERGDTFRLAWRTRGAASIAVEATDGRGTRAVDVSNLDPREDFLEVPLDFSTSFRLTVTNPFGEVSRTVVAGISNEAPDILAFGADPENVDAGGSSTVSWSSRGAVSGQLEFLDSGFGEVIETVAIGVEDLDDGSLLIEGIDEFVYLQLRLAGVGDEDAVARVVIGLHGQAGTLQVSEVFYDGGDLEPRLQWLELYNGAPFPVNLADTTLGWGLGDWTINLLRLPTLQIPAFGCVVVAGPDSVLANHNPVFDAPFLLPEVIPRAGARAAGVGLFADEPENIESGDNAFDGVVYGDALQDGDIFDIHGADAFAPFVEDAPPGQSLHRLVQGGFGVNGEEEPGKDGGEEVYGIEAFPEFYVLDSPTPGRCFGLHPPSVSAPGDAQVFVGRRRGPELGGNRVGLRVYNAFAGDTQVLFGEAVAACQDDFRGGGLLCTVPAGTGRVDLTLRKASGDVVYAGWYEYEPIDFCNLQFPLDASVERGQTLGVFGRVYEEGVTEAPGDSGAFVVQWGLGPADGDAAFAPESFAWFDARFNVQQGNDDEYQVDFLAENEGTFRHVFRVRLDDGDIWTYCDRDGTVNNQPGGNNFFEADASGTMEVFVPQ